jgi:hypothetical protein
VLNWGIVSRIEYAFCDLRKCKKSSYFKFNSSASNKRNAFARYALKGTMCHYHIHITSWLGNHMEFRNSYLFRCQPFYEFYVASCGSFYFHQYENLKDCFAGRKDLRSYDIPSWFYNCLINQLFSFSSILHRCAFDIKSLLRKS